MKKTIIEILSDYTCQLRFEDLPAEVVRKANDCFFDFVGCYFGAVKRDNITHVIEGITAFNPMPESTIWGTGLACGIAEASMAIGTAGYHLEYDDGISVAGHWGSSSIPATYLSVVKHNGNGEELITSIVAAYEVGTRISRMFSPYLLKKHIHFPCTMGAFAAATGYAKGAKTSSDVLAGALSLAGLFPVGTYSTAISGAEGKGLYSGWPNYLGINAVRLSDLGLTGDRDIMEAPDGFANAVGLAPMTDDQLFSAVEGLGTSYRFMEVYFKPYPCCRWLHAPIHSVLGLMKKNNLTKDDIVSIDIGAPEFAMMYNTHTGFDSKVACQYSIPYSVGAAAYFGKLDIDEFEESVRTDINLNTYIGRISMHIDDELQARFPEYFGVRLEITLKDGRVLTSQEGTPWGPDSPPDKEELVEKFVSLTNGVLSLKDQKEWIELYHEGFEHPDSFMQIYELLKKKI